MSLTSSKLDGTLTATSWAVVSMILLVTMRSFSKNFLTQRRGVAAISGTARDPGAVEAIAIVGLARGAGVGAGVDENGGAVTRSVVEEGVEDGGTRSEKARRSGNALGQSPDLSLVPDPGLAAPRALKARLRDLHEVLRSRRQRLQLKMQ